MSLWKCWVISSNEQDNCVSVHTKSTIAVYRDYVPKICVTIVHNSCSNLIHLDITQKSKLSHFPNLSHCTECPINIPDSEKDSKPQNFSQRLEHRRSVQGVLYLSFILKASSSTTNLVTFKSANPATIFYYGS